MLYIHVHFTAVINGFFFQQMMLCYFIMILFATVQAQTSEPGTGSCKDMLQGYMTGQLSSALGTYQVEALRQEFKSFTDVTEKAIKMFKEEIDADIERYQGENLALKLYQYFEICR